jgi:hypothetical protein
LRHGSHTATSRHRCRKPKWRNAMATKNRIFVSFAAEDKTYRYSLVAVKAYGEVG